MISIYVTEILIKQKNKFPKNFNQYDLLDILYLQFKSKQKNNI